MLIEYEVYMKIFNNTLSMEECAHEQCHFFNSERFHREAIYNLEKKLIAEPKCLGALCDWIASYHELALIYLQKGALIKAQKCLLIPHQSMLYMAQSHNGDREQEQTALNVLALTQPPLMAFAKIYPSCEQCMNRLKSQLALDKLILCDALQPPLLALDS